MTRLIRSKRFTDPAGNKVRVLTGTEFLPILTRQRDHARDHGQPGRAARFDGLIQRSQTGPATTGRS